MDSDLNTVGKAIKGDGEAFVKLIQERKDMLYRTAFLYVKNQQDALDIVDTAVYKAYVSIKKLKKSEFFNTWITKILINCALDLLRHRKKVVQLSENYDDGYIENDSTISIDLYNAVDKLQGKYKTAIILKYYNNLKISEVAEIIECSESNVKNYIHKALKELRVDFDEGGEYIDGRI